MQMVRCYCRWRTVLICVCMPCICLALLFAYVFVMVCIRMNARPTPITTSVLLKDTHFVASGLLNNKSFAPLPSIFWGHHLQNLAFWNQLQLTIDRQFNPILHPKKPLKELKRLSLNNSMLLQSFSKVDNSDFKVLPKQMQHYVRSMQKRDYPILLQPDGACGAHVKDEPPLLLFAIKTTELNFQNRHAIRQTWGQVGWVVGQKGNSSNGEEFGGYVRRVFLLGKAKNDKLGVDISDLLMMESNVYGDLLQWDFEDTFFNLTLKDVLFWRWFSSSCNRASFVFKGDDDVFVNTPKLIAYLQDQLQNPQAEKIMKEFMLGDVIGEAKPSRANDSKYFIPDSFYKGYYPTYAGGGGVVYSGLLTKRLHHMSKRVHLFPIDDVYVGMCMIRLNALPIHHPAFLTFDFPNKEEEQEECSYHTILLVHKRSPSQIIKLWDDVKKTMTKCRHVPLRVDKKKVTQTKENESFKEEPVNEELPFPI